MSERALILTRDPKLDLSLRRYLKGRDWEAFREGELSRARDLFRKGRYPLIFIDSRLWNGDWAGGARSLAADFPDSQFVVISHRDADVKGKHPGAAPKNLSVVSPALKREDLARALPPVPQRPRASPRTGRPSQRKTHTRPRLPIRVKITLPYVLLAFALAVAFAFVAGRLIFDTVEERYTNQLIEAGRLANEWMVLEEDRLLETGRALARTEGMPEAVVAGDRERVRRLALPIAVNAGEEAVEFLNSEGGNVVSLRREPEAPREEYEFTVGADLAGLHFVQPALEGAVDERGDKRAGLTLVPWGSYFYVVAPIYDANGEVAGAVLVGRSLASLVREMRQATFAQVSTYTAAGQPLETTFIEQQSLEGVDLDEGQSLRENSYTRELRVANIDYREILGPWEVRGREPVGLLGVSLPESFLVRASRWTRVQIGGVVAVGFVLVIVVGYLIANHITEPLLQVVRASREVADGNLAIQLRPRGNDEVASLASAFNHMVSSLRRSRVRLLNAYDSTLAGWSKALELRDNDTEGHTRRVVEMSTKLAKAMDLEGDQIIHLRRGAILHDIGKMGIPDGILRKPAPLSEGEWEVMRKHPVYAHQMLDHIDYLRPALAVPRHHHEWWDGTGYPEGLKGEEIPLSARIFAVVDVCDALLSDRPYRPAWTVKQTLAYIRSMRGSQFDPSIVDTFMHLVRRGEFDLQQHKADANGHELDGSHG